MHTKALKNIFNTHKISPKNVMTLTECVKLCKKFGIFPLYINHKELKELMRTWKQENTWSSLNLCLEYKDYLLFLRSLSCHCNYIKNQRKGDFIQNQKDEITSCECFNTVFFRPDSEAKYIEMHKWFVNQVKAKVKSNYGVSLNINLPEYRFETINLNEDMSPVNQKFIGRLSSKPKMTSSSSAHKFTLKSGSRLTLTTRDRFSTPHNQNEK